MQIIIFYVFPKDLPNNMIHQVSIKSLPQEWLWCETWCDDVSKKSAKTIDLVSAYMCLRNVYYKFVKNKFLIQ